MGFVECSADTGPSGLASIGTRSSHGLAWRAPPEDPWFSTLLASFIVSRERKRPFPRRPTVIEIDVAIHTD
jgi:hypothetical protein